jgi:hypothetical protein
VRAPPSQQELEAAHCWEADDRVPGRPAMTAYRRGLRYHQSQWRESHGHPIGTQPIVPRPRAPLSMLQHESGTWTWGRYVVVHPAGNADVADAVARYSDVLTDDATYATTTVETLLATRALPAATTRALRERYLPN